jgi:DNA processing protein
MINHRQALLALNRVPSVGPRTYFKLREHWPNIGEIFSASVDDLKYAGATHSTAQAIAEFRLEQIDEDLHWESQENQTIITLADADYPNLLKEIHDPPMVLYALGDLAALQQRAVGIVGTRNPSPSGSETARKFAYELAQQGLTIVSGLALGIDSQAHSGCLAAQGRTIAVMGTGIDSIYPYVHRKLAERISENGLLLSEFPLKVRAKAGHFPRRNRIISGLSLAILVVEAAIRSGSLITARLALEQNRDVLAVPGSIQNPQARGCHYLLQQGAKLVTSSVEVLEELGFLVNITSNKTSHALASDNKNLVKFIGFEVTTIDKILERSGLGIERVTCELADLELEGMVKAVPGGYVRCIYER